MTDVGDAWTDDAWRAALQASAPGSAHPDEAAWRQLFEGTLDPARRETILDHVAGCVTCAGTFKAARSAALDQIPAAVPARPRVIRLVPQLAAAAAVLAVTAVMVRQLMPPAAVPPAALAPAPVTPAPPAATSTPATAPNASPITIEKPPVVVGMEQLLVTRARGDVAAYTQALARALEPYKQDDFAEAARRLAAITKSHPDAFEPAFYLGASLLLSGKAQEAVPPLERAMALASAARREEARNLLTAAQAAARR